MTLKIVAKLDKSGSEYRIYHHYTFGKPGSDVNGGFYINKTMVNPPDFIEVEINHRGE